MIQENEFKVKRWGNSFAIIIPNEIAIEENIQEGDIVKMPIKKKKNVFDEIFGIGKKLSIFKKKSPEEILKQSRKEQKISKYFD